VLLRERLRRQRCLGSTDLQSRKHGTRLRAAGLVGSRLLAVDGTWERVDSVEHLTARRLHDMRNRCCGQALRIF